jgi:signal transduction histidine kinase
VTTDELDRDGVPALDVRRENGAGDGALPAWWHSLVPPPRTVPWSGMVLLALLLVHPLALTGVLDGPLTVRMQVAGEMSLLLQNVGVLGAAIVLKYAWRISRSPASGWLSAILSLVAIQNLPFSLLAVTGSSYGDFGGVNGLSTIVVSLTVAGLLALAVAGHDIPGPNPLLIGIPVGGVIAAARLALVTNDLDPTLRLGPMATALVPLAVALVTGVVLVALLRVKSLPTWARAGIVVATLLLVGGMSIPEGSSLVASVAHLVCGLVAVTLLLGVAVALLRTTIRLHTQQLLSLGQRLAYAEADLRHGKERMHELNSTVAGVTAAAKLLLDDGVPDSLQRARMRQLLGLEIERLGRMLDERVPGAPVPVAVDDVISPLVAVQQQLGQTVTWAPTGEVVMGRADDLAEVVHILLTNAERHAPGSPVDVTVSRADDRVTIDVGDRGPGIEPYLLRTLFAWGTRRRGSPGQGIGLQLARRLMVEQGGNLQLLTGGRRRGAAFRVTVPAAGEDGG